MFPHFPPPTIANKIPFLENPACFATAIAIGATVITAMSINTPTEVNIIVEIESAKELFFT